jgi:peptidoglycan/xylan/chitin deacetylase (PgdA/CDA1 family)
MQRSTIVNDGWDTRPNPVFRIIAVRTAQAALPILAVVTGIAWFAPALAINAVIGAGIVTAVGLSVYFGATFYARSTFGFPLLIRLPEDAGEAAALTIDDGPHPETTPLLLEVLSEHQAVATFFLVAERAKAYPELTRRIVREGHVIGVHGLRHREMVLLSADEIARELAEAEEIFAEILGAPLPSHLLRPPHGFKTRTLCRTATRLGWQIVAWSLDPRDYDAPDAATLTARLKDAQAGDIILLHERPGHSETAVVALRNALPSVMASLSLQSL